MLVSWRHHVFRLPRWRYADIPQALQASKDQVRRREARLSELREVRLLNRPQLAREK